MSDSKVSEGQFKLTTRVSSVRGAHVFLEDSI